MTADPLAALGPAQDAHPARLQTRLERERRARRRAEDLAEKATRGLYERQAELLLLEAVATASNQASTVEEVLRVAVDRVCAHTGWPVGHAYLRGRDPETLVSAGIWHLDDSERFEELRRSSEALSFRSGVGIPGRVLASGLPVWVVDPGEDSTLPRAGVYRELGLGTALAFPVLTVAKVAAVLEFFSQDVMEPDAAVLDLMAHVGTQLGRVIERKRGEEDLRRLSRRTELLLDSAGEGIYGIDATGKTIFANRAAAAMLGWGTDELIAVPMHHVVPHSRPDGQLSPKEGYPLYGPLKDGGVHRGDDEVFLTKDGRPFPAAYIATPISEDGAVVGAVITFNDISERKRYESRLRHLVHHDALTGLFNRRRFEEELSRELAHASHNGSEAALLVLDLDNFKYVNDMFGHSAGDEVIRSVATLLRGRLRSGDTLARLGGDEFAVLLGGADAETAQRVAGELCELVRRHPPAAAGALGVSTSIGVTLLDGRAVTEEELLLEADVAMYEAKEEGRGGWALYRPGQGRRGGLQAGLPWAERIRKALDEDLLALWCQPIVDLSSNDTSQYEVLVRMETKEGDIVLPDDFLPTAERFGLVQAIDRWVIREAIALAARRARARPEADLVLEVNLSARSLGDPDLVGFIEREMAAGSVDPASMIFEITETTAMAHIDEARRLASRLSGLGCRLALDDFGVGFGSFYYLKHLPLHYLKIDGDFIVNLPRSPVDQRMVGAMVEVARGLGLRTIAEFVGDEETVALLRGYGVDFVQGSHLGMPAPASSLEPGGA